jgi:outer membrane lipoprotein-sorting protein
METILFARHILIIAFLISGAHGLWSQYTSSAESDPEAARILARISEKLEKNPAYAAQFTLEVEYPGETPYTQEGKMIQQGNMFNLDLGAYIVVANTELKWLYHKPENTVNIYHADSEDAWKTPMDFLEIYQSEDFVFTLLPDQLTNNREEYWIEFKPLDDQTEYSKARMQVSRNTLEITAVKAFGKDGSIYLLTLRDIRYLPRQPEATFSFHPQDYPGIKIEDLRID